MKPKPNVYKQLTARMCVCVSLCTTVVHNTAQNSSDSFHSYPPDNHHSSDNVYWRGGGSAWHRWDVALWRFTEAPPVITASSKITPNTATSWEPCDWKSECPTSYEYSTRANEQPATDWQTDRCDLSSVLSSSVIDSSTSMSLANDRRSSFFDECFRQNA